MEPEELEPKESEVRKFLVLRVSGARLYFLERFGDSDHQDLAKDILDLEDEIDRLETELEERKRRKR